MILNVIYYKKMKQTNRVKILDEIRHVIKQKNARVQKMYFYSNMHFCYHVQAKWKHLKFNPVWTLTSKLKTTNFFSIETIFIIFRVQKEREIQADVKSQNRSVSQPTGRGRFPAGRGRFPAGRGTSSHKCNIMFLNCQIVWYFVHF